MFVLQGVGAYPAAYPYVYLAAQVYLKNSEYYPGVSPVCFKTHGYPVYLPFMYWHSYQDTI